MHAVRHIIKWCCLMKCQGWPHTHNIWHIRFPLWWYGCAHTHDVRNVRFPLWSKNVHTSTTYGQVWYDFVVYISVYLLSKTCLFWLTRAITLIWNVMKAGCALDFNIFFFLVPILYNQSEKLFSLFFLSLPLSFSPAPSLPPILSCPVPTLPTY